MKRVAELKIVRECTIQALEASINVLLKEGWSLRGHVFERKDRARDLDILCQVMVKFLRFVNLPQTTKLEE